MFSSYPTSSVTSAMGRCLGLGKIRFLTVSMKVDQQVQRNAFLYRLEWLEVRFVLFGVEISSAMGCSFNPGKGDIEVCHTAKYLFIWDTVWQAVPLTKTFQKSKE